MLKITLTDNGAIVKYDEGGNNDYAKTVAYKFDRHEHVDIHDFITMLYDISDAIMLFGKHSQQRIEINTIHGEKHECDGCDICKEVT